MAGAGAGYRCSRAGRFLEALSACRRSGQGGAMARTLITGMSATGKSTTTARLAQEGLRAVDLDTEEWSHWVPDDSPFATGGEAKDWRWRLDEVRALLAGEPDVVVVLTAPLTVVRHRLETRTTNDFGKDPGELERELELRAVVEPMLIDGACLVLDTARHDVEGVDRLVLEHHAARHRTPPLD